MPEGDYKNAQYVRRADGGITIDGCEVASTVMCVHCGAHWIPLAGSKIIRGWCTKCMGPICGPKCAKCIPYEKWIEQIEKGV